MAGGDAGDEYFGPAVNHRRSNGGGPGVCGDSARGGRESIDHAPGARNDLINAVAGMAAATNRGKYRYDSTLSWVG